MTNRSNYIDMKNGVNIKMEIKDSDKTSSSVSDETEKINEIKRAVAYNLLFTQGVMPFSATPNDYYLAVARTVRDRMQLLFVNTIYNLRNKKTQDCRLPVGGVSHGAASRQQSRQPGAV